MKKFEVNYTLTQAGMMIVEADDEQDAIKQVNDTIMAGNHEVDAEWHHDMTAKEYDEAIEEEIETA